MTLECSLLPTLQRGHLLVEDKYRSNRADGDCLKMPKEPGPTKCKAGEQLFDEILKGEYFVDMPMAADALAENTAVDAKRVREWRLGKQAPAIVDIPAFSKILAQACLKQHQHRGETEESLQKRIAELLKGIHNYKNTKTRQQPNLVEQPVQSRPSIVLYPELDLLRARYLEEIANLKAQTERDGFDEFIQDKFREVREVLLAEIESITAPARHRDYESQLDPLIEDIERFILDHGGTYIALTPAERDKWVAELAHCHASYVRVPVDRAEYGFLTMFLEVFQRVDPLYYDETWMSKWEPMRAEVIAKIKRALRAYENLPEKDEGRDRR